LASRGVFTASGIQEETPPAEPMFAPIPMGSPAAAAPAVAPPVGPAPKRSALVSEEDIPDLGTLAGMLGAAGYAVRAVGTRKQFIDEMNQPQPPDVIFLKLESTVLDAFKTIDRIRQHPQLGQIPVVISGAS